MCFSHSGATIAAVRRKPKNQIPDARSSQSAAKRSAGVMGPSGMSSKKPSASRVVERAVDQSRENTGDASRSHATTETTPDRERSFSQPLQSASPQNAQTTVAGTSRSSQSLDASLEEARS
jgi:hypothetical protein